jgi:hypothetical protein
MFRNDLANASADVLCGDGTCAVQARFERPPDHARLLPPSALHTDTFLMGRLTAFPASTKRPKALIRTGRTKVGGVGLLGMLSRVKGGQSSPTNDLWS